MSRPPGPAPGVATCTARSIPCGRPSARPREGLDGLLRTAGVPVWLPWPLRRAGWWRVSPARATSAPVSAPARWRCRARTRSAAPLTGDRRRGTGHRPGRGAGRPGRCGPRRGVRHRAAGRHAWFGKHDFPLWQVDSPDRAVFAGEIKGYWLWLVLWPETAGVLLVEPIALRDLRDPGQDLDLPFGAASVRLAAG